MTVKILKSIACLIVTLGMVYPLSHWVEKRTNSELKVMRLLSRAADQLDERTRQEIAQTITDVAKKYRIDPVLILSIMKVESMFDPKAVSRAKAYGLMQVRPIVVKDVATEMGIHPKDQDKLLKSHKFNIEVGVHYLSKLVIKFKGDIKKALMAYNAGPTFVEKLYKNRPVPEGGYQGRVLKAYGEFSKS